MEGLAHTKSGVVFIRNLDDPSGQANGPVIPDEYRLQMERLIEDSDNEDATSSVPSSVPTVPRMDAPSFSMKKSQVSVSEHLLQMVPIRRAPVPDFLLSLIQQQRVEAPSKAYALVHAASTKKKAQSVNSKRKPENREDDEDEDYASDTQLMDDNNESVPVPGKTYRPQQFLYKTVQECTPDTAEYEVMGKIVAHIWSMQQKQRECTFDLRFWNQKCNELYPGALVAKGSREAEDVREAVRKLVAKMPKSERMQTFRSYRFTDKERRQQLQKWHPNDRKLLVARHKLNQERETRKYKSKRLRKMQDKEDPRSFTMSSLSRLFNQNVHHYVNEKWGFPDRITITARSLKGFHDQVEHMMHDMLRACRVMMNLRGSTQLSEMDVMTVRYLWTDVGLCGLKPGLSQEEIIHCGKLYASSRRALEKMNEEEDSKHRRKRAK